MDAIVTRELSKSYGRRRALHNLTLRVPAGSLFGFLGPNGAGKTTAIRILLGLLRASGGQATVLGQDAWHDGPRLRRDLGYLPGEIRLYEQMTGRALLDFLNAARGRQSGPEIERLAERFALDLRTRIRNYSRGMKQKLGLIQALMHRPRLLVLDEPTTALDPLMRQVLYEELRAAAAAGRTVLFSSHTLSEVEALCDRVAILRDGRLVEQDELVALQRRARQHLEVRFRDGAPAAVPAPLQVLARDGRRLSGTWQGTAAELVAWLATCPLEEVRIGAPDLEELFMTYYQRETEAGP